MRTAMTPAAELVDAGKRVTLAECPIGLFLYANELCLKTEYGNDEGRIDAYIVSSGEFFWGDSPQTIESQHRQLVRPVKVVSARVEAADAEVKALAERLRDSRLSKGWSLQDLAIRAGCTKAHLSGIENSKSANPTIGLVGRIAAALEVEPAWLAGWSDAERMRPFIEYGQLYGDELPDSTVIYAVETIAANRKLTLGDFRALASKDEHDA